MSDLLLQASHCCPSCGLRLEPGTRLCPRDGTNVLAAMERDPLIGQTVGDYRITTRIGNGAMGIVYEGIQPLIGKRVAIKVLRPELAADPQQTRRLVDEARTVNAIRHRGIVDIFGIGQLPTDGRQYLILEYLSGMSLEEMLVNQRSLPPHRVLPILDEVLAAIGAAHKAGVIHRDLKPSNLFIVEQKDGSSYVKVLDFGLATRGIVFAQRSDQTLQTGIFGTPDYMAPEQIRGEDVSPATDLYALGILAFRMLTGRLPFVCPSMIELMSAHLSKEPMRPSFLDPTIPPELDALVLSLMAKAPTQRPHTADAVRGEIKHLSHLFSQAVTQVGIQRPAAQADDAVATVLAHDAAHPSGSPTPIRLVANLRPAAKAQDSEPARPTEVQMPLIRHVEPRSLAVVPLPAPRASPSTSRSLDGSDEAFVKTEALETSRIEELLQQRRDTAPEVPIPAVMDQTRVVERTLRTAMPQPVRRQANWLTLGTVGFGLLLGLLLLLRGFGLY